MKTTAALIIAALLSAACLYAAEPTKPLAPAYAVNRPVSDFPTNEDLSTPEAACAAFCRALAGGGEAAYNPALPKQPLPAKYAQQVLGAEIVEVGVFEQTNAIILSKSSFEASEQFHLWWFARQEARWRHTYDQGAGTLGEAHEAFSGCREVAKARMELGSRPPIANPQAYLRPFVEFLRAEAAKPKAFLLQSLADHPLVIMGEAHHRARYWAFNSSLVRDKAFARRVGVIYLECQCNDQPLVDQFLAAPSYDPQPVIEMLRNCQWDGQAELEFYKAVWEANQGLPKDQRLRIVLVDSARPWKQIKTAADKRKWFQVNRDQIMADNLLRDLRQHASDPRHAFLIVGVFHASENVTRMAVSESAPFAVIPYQSAGRRLRTELGATNVFAICQHAPVMGNYGELNGRIALGLFETAFAAQHNRPMAFPLDHGPFGQQIFDAPLNTTAMGLFRDNFQAYLYLGPLETETRSPHIPAFYTDDFVKEMDRQCRLDGRGLLEFGVKDLTAASWLEWQKQQPGYGWHCGNLCVAWSARSLGPITAWQCGSDWKKQMVLPKLQNWQQHQKPIRKDALRLFEAIRHADYAYPDHFRPFLGSNAEYQPKKEYNAWMTWVSQHFRTNPVVAVDLGKVALNTNGLPALPYKLRLRNDEQLEGVLPMNWNPGSQQWYGVGGLDWHLPQESPKQAPPTMAPITRFAPAAGRCN